MPIGSVINPLIRSANALPALRYDKRGDFVRPCLAWSSYFGALFGVIVSRCGGRHLPYRACLPLRCLFCVRTPWYSAFSVAPPPPPPHHLIAVSLILLACHAHQSRSPSGRVSSAAYRSHRLGCLSVQSPRVSHPPRLIDTGSGENGGADACSALRIG